LTFKIFLYIKIVVILSIIFQASFLTIKLKNYYKDFYDNYRKININLNLTFYKNIKEKKKINIAIYSLGIKNGGRARITTLLIKYLYEIKIFKIFLFTCKLIEKDEYIIPSNIKRFRIKNDLIKIINKNKIDILIYELDDIEEIMKLNNYININIIFYQHSSSFDWLYGNYTIFKTIYEIFYSSKYIISIVPFDNDYLFKKWGLNTILMKNFMTHDFNYIFSSDLSTEIILLIGRGNAKKKRFYIGIEAFDYIAKEFPNCELNIISNLTGIERLQNLVNNLNLEKNIQFNGYSSVPDIYFKNASLNIFPSISEAFPMVISETKIYGIPSVIIGIDYILIAKGGTIIIYDDRPESLAAEAIKLMESKEYRKKLGKEARNSMKKFNNELLLGDWVKLILSIYKGEYIKLEENNLSEDEGINILNNQLKLLKMRYEIFQNITRKEFENYTYLKNIQLY
jgi:hypothetical protein